jgi:hypothetical protein
MLSPQKTRVLIFGEGAYEKKVLQQKIVWTLGNEVIPETLDIKHVGISLNSLQQSALRTKAAVKKGKTTFMELAGAGVKPQAITPKSSVRIYKSIILSSAMYGCEVWYGLAGSEIIELERMQRFCCKMMQGLPKRTRSDMCTSLLGLYHMHVFID